MGGGKLETPARGQARPGKDGRVVNAAGTNNLTSDALRGNALAHRVAPFAANLDPATLAAIGLAGARIWDALS